MDRTATVIRPGLCSTVQDRGRHGYRHLAVGTAGALDSAAAALANRLVGNDEPDDPRSPGHAVLETTLDGLTLRFDHSAYVAVTGARCEVAVDGAPVAHAGAVAVPAGAELRVGTASVGLRCYVAVDGGFHVSTVLGSRSYDTLCRLGPPPLASGDVLPLGPGAVRQPAAVDVDTSTPLPRIGEVVEVAAWLGPRHDWIAPAALAALIDESWTVTAASDRVALRLAGSPLRRNGAVELSSEGLVTGAVQVPPDGQPLVFLADHPTTGGYPVVAVVPEPECARLAQLRPGDRLRFRPGGPGWEAVRR